MRVVRQRNRSSAGVTTNRKQPVKAIPAVVEHCIAGGSNRGLQTHLDQFLPIEFLQYFFGERPWQMKSLRNSGRRRLRHHGDVFQCQVAKETLTHVGVRQFFRSWWTQGFHFGPR